MLKLGPIDTSAMQRGLEQRAVLAKRDALTLGKTLGPGYVKGNFRRQEGPGGKSWDKTRRGGRIFYDKLGRMEKGIQAEIRGDVVWLGAGDATKAYNAAHNFGVKTKPHIIRPRNAKPKQFQSGKKQGFYSSAVLAFSWRGGKGFFRFVNHPGSLIPKREFMYLRDQDRASLVRAMQALYVKRLNGK